MRLRVGSENMENLMTVVDRLDELQASSVGRRECTQCSSTRQRTGARRMDVHVDTYSQPCHGRRAVATAQARVMEVSQGSGVCAWSCCYLANGNKTCLRLFIHVISNMTRGSQGFVGQSSPNLAQVSQNGRAAI